MSVEEDLEDNVSTSASSTAHPLATYHSLLAGIGSGTVCTLLCSPLDVTKIRLQLQGAFRNRPPKYSGSILNISRTIFNEEGIRGFYKGLTPALCTVPLFWGNLLDIQLTICQIFCIQLLDIQLFAIYFTFYLYAK